MQQVARQNSHIWEHGIELEADGKGLGCIYICGLYYQKKDYYRGVYKADLTGGIGTHLLNKHGIPDPRKDLPLLPPPPPSIDNHTGNQEQDSETYYGEYGHRKGTDAAFNRKAYR